VKRERGKRKKEKYGIYFERFGTIENDEFEGSVMHKRVGFMKGDVLRTKVSTRGGGNLREGAGSSKSV